MVDEDAHEPNIPLRSINGNPIHWEMRKFASPRTAALFYTPIPEGIVELGNGMRGRVVSPYAQHPRGDKPNVILVEDFVSPVELRLAAQIIARNCQHFTVSTVGDGPGVRDIMRTSETMVWSISDSPLAKTLAHRAANCVFASPNLANCPELLAYTGDGRDGGFFRVHHDMAPYTDPNSLDATEATPDVLNDYIDMIDQVYTYRNTTGFAYLNTVASGEGGTHFPLLGFTQSPVAGAALFWPNVLPDGRIQPWTVHAGLPVVESGVQKFATNLWISAIDLPEMHGTRPPNAIYEGDVGWSPAWSPRSRKETLWYRNVIM